MHGIIEFLKDAAERGSHSGINNAYVVKNKNIYARNSILQAGIAWPSKAEFTLSADAVDAALARMKGEVGITVNRDTVVFKCGRLSSSIDRIHEEPAAMPVLPAKGWKPCPPGLGEAFRKAKPFLGDRSWQQGARILKDNITAFSGHGGIQVTVPGLAQKEPILLTEPVLNFIIAQGDPDEYVVDDLKCWCARWEDGRWVRAQQLIGNMDDDIIEGVFERAGKETPVSLSPEWREVLDDAEALSDNTIRLSSKGLQGKKANITTDVDITIKVSPEHESYWKSKLMSAMLDVATAWNPERYPDPALFVGDGIRGVLAGFRK